MKNNYLIKILIILIILPSFSCSKKDISEEVKNINIQEKFQSNEIKSTIVNQGGTLLTPNSSPTPSLSNEEIVRLLAPTERELNNQVKNEPQFTDINSQ